MSATGQAGIFSFAPQPEKFGDDPYSSAGLTFHRVRSPRIGLGTVGPVTPFDLETGGPITPSGTYKTLHYGAGDVDLYPRCHDVLGWLLYAALGDVTSATVPGATGAYLHSFRFDATGRQIPWLALRKFIPGATSAGDNGEEFWDAQIAGFELALPQMGPAAMSLMLQSLNSQPISDPAGWTYSAAAEDTRSVPVAGFSTVKILGERIPTINAVVSFANGLTRPEDEAIHGSYNPEDFTVLNRSASIRFIYKYSNADLYAWMHTGSKGGTNWTNEPTSIDTAGGNKAIEINMKAPASISGSAPDTKYSLTMWGDRATLIPGAVLEVAAGQMITQEFTLLFEDPADSAKEYVAFDLVNGKSAYTWPTP